MPKPTHKVTCPNAFAAAVLATILDREGHPALWHIAANGDHVVLAAAPFDAMTAACASAQTITRGGK